MTHTVFVCVFHISHTIFNNKRKKNDSFFSLYLDSPFFVARLFFLPISNERWSLEISSVTDSYSGGFYGFFGSVLPFYISLFKIFTLKLTLVLTKSSQFKHCRWCDAIWLICFRLDRIFWRIDCIDRSLVNLSNFFFCFFEKWTIWFSVRLFLSQTENKLNVDRREK